MNVNFGLLADYSKKEKETVIKRALETMAEWKRATDDRLGISPT
ncbi:MAG: hypothetical protein A4E57_02423 [Syntrophorhabdaceae bacterium PtaU1.Bin034]|nr:MAG: hypothetical protein A4E57_02423 [Syntrophorhabdaceae bacterium PtaU1.Bin034]